MESIQKAFKMDPKALYLEKLRTRLESKLIDPKANENL